MWERAVTFWFLCHYHAHISVSKETNFAIWSCQYEVFNIKKPLLLALSCPFLTYLILILVAKLEFFL